MTLPSAEPMSMDGAYSATTQSPTSAATTITATSSTVSNTNDPRHASLPSGQHYITPTSPPYPPYGFVNPGRSYIQANGYHSNDIQHQRPPYSQQSQQAYVVYPTSPHFYYSEYRSYPGSPVLHPQSPPINPTSPPFSPMYQYQVGNNGVGPSASGANVELSPTFHRTYTLQHQHPAPHFPPLHISSPVLTGTPVAPHPYQMIALPGPYHPTQQQQQQHYPQHQRHRGRKRHLQSQPSHQQSNSSGQQAVSEALTNHHPQNIYVRGLSSSTTDESFLELCKAYGPVVSSKAILDQKTGECKGYGFALFEQEQDCHTALDGLNRAGLQASFARVGLESFSSKLRNLQDETSTNIYLSNLPLDMTEQKLEELFLPFKTVSSRLLCDPRSGISRGVGFARMIDRSAADAIIERFNGHVMPGSVTPLQVRYADSVAQKKLKNQTSRKCIVRPREFQSISAGFSSIQHMPITPETMLGFVPANPSMPTSSTVISHQMVDHQDSDHLHAVQHNLKMTESPLDSKADA